MKLWNIAAGRHSNHDMQEINEDWINDYTSWMSKENQRAYEQQLASTDRRGRQRYHHMRRQTSNAFLSEVIGNNHVLLAVINHMCARSVSALTRLQAVQHCWNKHWSCFDASASCAGIRSSIGRCAVVIGAECSATSAPLPSKPWQPLVPRWRRLHWSGTAPRRAP